MTPQSYNRTLIARLRSEGRCVDCGEPALSSNRQYCERHRLMQNARDSRYNFRKQVAAGRHPVLRGPRVVKVPRRYLRDTEAMEFVRAHPEVFRLTWDRALWGALPLREGDEL